MSAYILSQEHIDCLVDAALTALHNSGFSYYHNGERHPVDPFNIDDLGRMLWRENIKSVAYRYQERTENNTLPGPIPTPDPESYHHEHIPYLVNPVVVLKAIACYEYQTCEHPEWEESAACAFCEALRSRMIYLLPGYEEAPGWDITDRKVYRRAYSN